MAKDPAAPPDAPPEAWEPLLRLARIAGRPLERFLRIEAASGILLLVAAAVALAWANSPWADVYTDVWHTPVGIRVGDFRFERSLAWVVNDGLMVIFFFVVGLEIRREIHHGELSDWRRAALPAAGAVGGMVVPALLYLTVAGAPATRHGWGIPIATDIAFAVGVLTLLGKRVPAAVRVLLLALAVIDDLGAIAVIAVFYSSGIAASGLVAAALGVAAIYAMQKLGIRHKVAYVAPGLVVWAGTYAAGIHPTIAGVIIGLMMPVREWVGAEATSPAESLIAGLHPWVAFVIMPVFALANAGVSLAGLTFAGDSVSVVVGTTLGLVVGKPVGVVLAAAIAVRLRVAKLPAGLGHRHLLVLGMAAGIGFTMALFIAQLAFADPVLLGAGKLGVLVASGVAIVLALVAGRLLAPAAQPATETCADEVEGAAP
jgi:NhaA family Na+:H+ antiporter